MCSNCQAARHIDVLAVYLTLHRWNVTLSGTTANLNIADLEHAPLQAAKCVAPLLSIRIRSPAYFRWITTGTRIIIPMYRFVLTAGSERGRIGAECETEGQVSQFKIADRTGKQAGRTVAGRLL